MAIFAECPICRKKQSVTSKLCTCGENLDQAKKAGRVKYWIDYYLPSGRRKREPVGFSIKEAQDAEGKKRGQKREKRLFDVLPEAKMTFSELAEWYLGLEKTKGLASYSIIEVYLRKFNTRFGSTIIDRISPADLEDLVEKRKREGAAGATIDQEIGKVRAMVRKAFDNNIVGAETIRTFSKIGKLSKGNANARDRIITAAEYSTLLEKAPMHLRPILAMAYHTGMRKSEILGLTWDKVDMKGRIIHLEAEDTKDREKRSIPISDALYFVLQGIPRAIHDPHVFLYRGSPVEDIRAALRASCEAARIKYGREVKGGFIFHDLRHTFNTNMRKAGVSESVIMKITGHSTRQMFDRYNKVDEGDLRQAIEKMKVFSENSDHFSDQTRKPKTKG